MRAIDVGVIARAPRHPGHAPFALVRHASPLGFLRANQERLGRLPKRSRKAAFALGGILWVLTVLERLALAAWAREVDMMLLSLLELFHIRCQVDCLPSCGLQAAVPLVRRPAAHQGGVLVLRPGGFNSVPFLLPSLWVAVDHPADVARIVAVAPQHLQQPLLAQVDEL